MKLDQMALGVPLDAPWMAASAGAWDGSPEITAPA